MQYRLRTKNQVYTIDLTTDVNSQPAWEDKVDGIPGHTDIPKLREGMVGAQVGKTSFHNGTVYIITTGNSRW